MMPSTIYHIYNHGNAEDNLFRCDENYRYFLQKYGEYIKPVVKTYAYCLLPNHFHFLIQVHGEDVLTNLTGFENLLGVKLQRRIVLQFSNFFNAYTKAFNKMYDRKGKLFLSPFKRKCVINPWQFLNTWRYVHYNPVRHQFVEDPFDWPFSSIHDYRQNKDHFVLISEAQRLAESSLGFTALKDFKPNWSDFIEFDY